jgi:hypothetical protein
MIYLVGLLLLWFRSEYAFVFFFGIGLAVLDFAFLVLVGGVAAISDPSILSLSVILEVVLIFILARLPILTIFLVLGCAIVAFRKWQKGHKSPRDAALDAEMERIRAEIAARESPPPAGS